jgi:hypothetical protein
MREKEKKENNNIDSTRFKGSIPTEINTHLHNYKKEMWDVDTFTDEICDICGAKIDTSGFCRCGTGSIG